MSVNLPRWGLKLGSGSFKELSQIRCKFTPLGFETMLEAADVVGRDSVNLPRWGLKLDRVCFLDFKIECVNLPRWGLKQENFKEAKDNNFV